MLRFAGTLLLLCLANVQAQRLRVISPLSGPLVASSSGLTTPGGIGVLNRLVMALDQSHYLLYLSSPEHDQTVLEVLGTSGRLSAKRSFKGLNVGAFATRRGPCVAEDALAATQQVTRCFDVDLKRVWKTISGSVSLVNDAGTTAYLAAVPSRRDVLEISRLDLITGARSSWSVSTLEVGEEPSTRSTHADLLAAFPVVNFTASVTAQLPDQRVLVCLGFELPHWGCRWSIHDARTGRLLKRLDTGVYVVTNLQVSPTGRYLYTFQNTLRVWDARTGRLTLTLHDPAWATAMGAGGVGPREVLFTADERRAVVIVRGEDERPNGSSPYRAFVYAVPSGLSLASFDMGNH